MLRHFNLLNTEDCLELDITRDPLLKTDRYRRKRPSVWQNTETVCQRFLREKGQRTRLKSEHSVNRLPTCIAPTFICYFFFPRFGSVISWKLCQSLHIILCRKKWQLSLQNIFSLHTSLSHCIYRIFWHETLSFLTLPSCWFFFFIFMKAICIGNYTLETPMTSGTHTLSMVRSGIDVVLENIQKACNPEADSLSFLVKHASAVTGECFALDGIHPKRSWAVCLIHLFTGVQIRRPRRTQSLPPFFLSGDERGVPSVTWQTSILEYLVFFLRRRKQYSSSQVANPLKLSFNHLVFVLLSSYPHLFPFHPSVSLKPRLFSLFTFHSPHTALHPHAVFFL